VTAALLVAATTASAANGLGPLPAAPTSQADVFAGADVSDGVTVEEGILFGFFEKGDESFGGSDTTTVVNFTLPTGVTVRHDPDECGEFDVGGYCLLYDTNCDPSGNPDSVVTVNGNTIEFRLACEPGGESSCWPRSTRFSAKARTT
jgi:hypothetical protein